MINIKNTNKVILIFGMASILFGCGRKPERVIDPTFEPYVKSFEARSAEQGSPVTVSDLILKMVPKIEEKFVLGVCYSGGDETPRVEISEEYWVNLKVQAREQLIFHELGHCVLARDHREEKNNSYPLSIMNPYLFSSTLYEANYGQYQYELFTNNDLNLALPLKGVITSVGNSFASVPSFNQYGNNASHIGDSVDVFEKVHTPDSLLTEEELEKFNCDHGTVRKEE